MDGELIRASSVKEALSLKDQNSVFFAGGTGIGWKDSGICAKRLIVIPDEEEFRTISLKNGLLRIGALVTLSQALECPDVPAYLKEAIRFCGSLQKRNMATVCGNIAFWRDDSYLVPTLIAAGACLCIALPDGEEQIEIAQYASNRERFEGGLITAVILQAEEKGDSSQSGTSLKVLSKRYANTVESHACLTIAMGRDKDTYRIGVAIKGCGIFLPDIMNWDVSWKKAGVKDDFFGTEEYKRYLTQVTLDDMYETLSMEGGDGS